MLNYSVKLGESNIKKDEIVWGEKYLSPDLSFVSGVTDQIYHLDKDMYVSASIGKNSNFSRLSVESTNVTRNGFIVVKGKQYRIKTAKSPAIGQQESVNYIEVNGVYYYLPTAGNTFTVKNQLKQEWKRVNGDYKVDIVEGDVTATVSNGVVKIDTIFWIENDTVNIDGYTYIFDKYDEGIKFYETGRNLLPNEITPCDDITYNYFDKISDYKYVTKFTLRKSEDKIIETDRISYCTYFYYVYYKDYYCPVKKSGNGYICQIPVRLLDGSDSQAMSSTTVTADTVSTSLPSRISQLKSYDSYVTIQGVKFPVDYAVQNANGGDEIAIYATDETHNLGVGDKLTLSYYNPTSGNSMLVYSVDSKDFVMYDNCKYLLEPAIADTIKMNGVEYDVSYPNGKVDGKDALVSIDGEDIPMKIVDSKSKLERYGLVVTGDSQANTARYNIVPHDGVKIADKIYRVRTYETSSSRYIVTNLPTTTEFIIESVEGSSLFICAPNLSRYEYSEAFINEMSANLCDLYASNANNVTVYSKNRAFGVREITPTIGKLMGTGSVSSDDYYNLFNNLTLFTNSGYIQIDVPLTMDVANNTMQEDIVEKDFFEAEKKKAINPIVDMEKDVYVPMFMEKNKLYRGSDTDFYQVTEIDVNLHFRTRNLDNWKVNDSNTNLEYVGKDNWFCTDYEPYKSMIESGNMNDTDLILNTSDIMGLLNFDNDDVFYQKDNVAKSFLRFSYYDTPDPNTQSLLCTSTVFVDEHAMYDKYIDNARKNVNGYGLVEDVKYSDTDNNTTEFSGDIINRISVLTECLEGKYNARKKAYNIEDIDRKVMRNDSKRVSSRFIINNKYTTDTSSEGFYLYMFREYSENLRPKPIYMKVEFNHAGVGRTIPFIVPMKWKYDTDNEYVPDRKLTLDTDDLDDLKKGYPLSYVYAQTYIPLYAVYDYKHKQYAYVFDDRYVVMEDNKVILNMFEIKIENETTYTINARAQVRNNNVERARIDVNKRQFNSNI